MKCCAICGAGPCPTTDQPLGRDDAMVPVCAECDAPPTARYGPQVAYEPSGFVTAAAMDSGMRKVLGDARADAEIAAAIKFGNTPAAPQSEADRIYMEHVADTKTRVRTKAHVVKSRRSRRDRKVF